MQGSYSGLVAVCGATSQPRRWRTLPVSGWRPSLTALPACPGERTRRGSARSAACSCQMRAEVTDYADVRPGQGSTGHGL
jgi:hypothetical protein